MLLSTILSLASAALVSAHTIITYPGWRGDNLVTNASFPYGMQWMYPCGGILPTQNRTFWPTTGGAVAFQPGWFQGHATAFVYINLGFGTDGPNGGPPNMSNPMVPPFQILGPSKNPYPGTVCLPQVPLPVNASVQAGDNATIQVVELAVHGAALYSCVDITFVEPNDPRLADVNESNCFNSNDIGYADVYTLTVRASGQGNTTSGAEHRFWYFRRHNKGSILAYLGWMPVVLGGLWVLL
ncbi:putative gpi anchored protein [Diplogelasinospora grovesii]|uniref:Gpi anchored protein n=1 Tax=Diplogelasinospora grovesii TaxID=303347 RepID=A0AAN6ND11_9PEZI|nr:putative gpi anchored protein [Diplogelasinospora grovesii]